MLRFRLISGDLSASLFLVDTQPCDISPMPDACDGLFLAPSPRRRLPLMMAGLEFLSPFMRRPSAPQKTIDCQLTAERHIIYAGHAGGYRRRLFCGREDGRYISRCRALVLRRAHGSAIGADKDSRHRLDDVIASGGDDATGFIIKPRRQ